MTIGRECKQCLEWKPAESFSWKLRGKRLAARCNVCRNKNYNENPEASRARANRHYHANRVETLAKMRAHRQNNIASSMIVQARGRARKSGVPFALKASDISVPSVCPVLGIPLVVNEGKCGPNSPSLDRIVGSLGYVPGNVIVISLRANTIKNDASLEELERVITYYRAALAVAVTAANT